MSIEFNPDSGKLEYHTPQPDEFIRAKEEQDRLGCTGLAVAVAAVACVFAMIYLAELVHENTMARRREAAAANCRTPEPVKPVASNVEGGGK